MAHSVLVIGLGRFGSAAALELSKLGHEVLAIDSHEDRVNELAPHVTRALQLDATDPDALRAVGAGDFDHAIVAISESVEASVFATMALKELGVGIVIAKAGSRLHGEILAKAGADRVVFPEREMGQRVAHSFSVRDVVDYLDVARDMGIVKVHPPASFVGRSFRDLDLGGRLGLTPVAVRRGDAVTVNPPPETVVQAGDELILIGHDNRLELLDK
jgi:trk system potassium uptake protein TrkA